MPLAGIRAGGSPSPLVKGCPYRDHLQQIQLQQRDLGTSPCATASGEPQLLHQHIRRGAEQYGKAILLSASQCVTGIVPQSM